MASKIAPKTRVAAPAQVVKTTPARNTPIPKVAATAAPMASTRKAVSHEMIAKRAFEISLSGKFDETGNWLAAERELKGL